MPHAYLRAMLSGSAKNVPAVDFKCDTSRSCQKLEPCSATVPTFRNVWLYVGSGVASRNPPLETIAVTTDVQEPQERGSVSDAARLSLFHAVIN